MTDDHSLDMMPRAEFADRLEADLLREIGNRPEIPSIPNSEENFVIVEQTTTPPSHRPRWWLAAAALVIAVAAVAAVASVRQGDTSSVDQPGSQPVTFTIHWAYSDVNQDCPKPGSSEACFNHFAIPAAAQMRGDVDGFGYQGLFWNEPVDYSGQQVDHLEHIGAYNISATVASCGTGRFMLVELMQFKSGANRDRPSGTYIGTWQIVPESGRGALVSISGSGTSSGSFGTADVDGRTFTGNIAC